MFCCLSVNLEILQVSLFQTLVTRHSGSPVGSPAIVRRRRKEEQEEEDGKEAIGLLSPLLIRFLNPLVQNA